VISDAELLDYARPVNGDDDLPTLRRLERAAVAHVQARTGRYFGHESEIIEYIPRRGNALLLANEPIGDSLVFEYWDGSAWSEVAADAYTIDGKTVRFTATGWSYVTGPTRYRATYDAGYAEVDGDSTEAPEDVKQAVLLLVGHWFENREAVVVGQTGSAIDMAVDALLAPHTQVAV
jgi:uncharacterized phiE125 gp8 family phage protein